MSDPAALSLALVLLAVSLAAAVVRPRWMPEGLAAAGGALVLVGVGAIGASDAWDAVADLLPTVAFLAALLVLAEGCRRDGLFDAIGAVMARRAGRRPRRLLGLVFLVGTAVTAVLSLDATVVLLTPVVFATAALLRTSPRPHVYACVHLANSASLLLPVSNLTNLLAFHASGLSFVRFAALMVLPAAAVLTVEWFALSRFFATRLDRPRAETTAPARPRVPRLSVVVLVLTLTGFALSSALGVAPLWVAIAGASAISLPALVGGQVRLPALARAAEPEFLVFVLGLGAIVAAAGRHGLDRAVEAVLPSGAGVPSLLLVAAIAAVLANLVNNLPATLILVPVATAAGSVSVLAVLIGVNVGPNLTYAGSLATLLWRRVIKREDADVELGEFVRLGARTVPAGLLAGTACLWFAAQVVGTG